MPPIMKKRLFPAAKPVDLAVVLAALYLLILAVVPFEAIDRGLSRLVFHYGVEGWNTSWLWAVPLYGGAKIFSGLFAAGLAVWAVRAYRADNQPLTDALIRVLMSAVLTLGLMLLMKHTSGVACPWSLPEFNPQKTSSLITPFAWLFSDASYQGKCWPAGHATTGFCFFGLYFAARRLKVRHAGWVLAAVTLYGGLCATARLLQGAHFLSHSVATMLLSFATAGVIFWPDSKEKMEMNVTQAALFSAVPLTLLSVPFFASLAKSATLGGFLAMISTGLLFAFLWTGLFLLLARFLPNRGWRAALALLTLLGAGADAFTTLYGTVMTPDMVRNALATDWHEATELVGWRWVARTALFALPGLAVALFAPPVVRGAAADFRSRLLFVTKGVAAFVVTAVFLLSQFSTLAAFMRNDKQARYLIEPAAVVYSTARTLIADGTPENRTRAVIDPEPALVAAPSEKPLLVVLVVGETVRAANWGLNGYARNTTPELARRGVINFTNVTSCGTSTDVSLPCMFSRVGRSDYDRDRILSEESVLSVIERAGVTVHWVDNQSGCKGACSKEMSQAVARNDADCPGGVCYDGAMLGNVREALASPAERSLLVLHSMGNHGPAYWKRAPAGFHPFGAGCLKDDLGQCRPEDVVASYDNAVAYADRFLSNVIDLLAADQTHDTVLLYLSDHGESLGEKGLWLHGAPYWMKLDEQTKVPMILWMNLSAQRRFGLNAPSADVAVPVSHDNLADTLFDLTGVATKLFRPRASLLSVLKSGEARQ